MTTYTVMRWFEGNQVDTVEASSLAEAFSLLRGAGDSFSGVTENGKPRYFTAEERETINRLFSEAKEGANSD